MFVSTPTWVPHICPVLADVGRAESPASVFPSLLFSLLVNSAFFDTFSTANDTYSTVRPSVSVENESNSLATQLTPSQSTSFLTVAIDSIATVFDLNHGRVATDLLSATSGLSSGMPFPNSSKINHRSRRGRGWGVPHRTFRNPRAHELDQGLAHIPRCRNRKLRNLCETREVDARGRYEDRIGQRKKPPRRILEIRDRRIQHGEIKIGTQETPECCSTRGSHFLRQPIPSRSEAWLPPACRSASAPRSSAQRRLRGNAKYRFHSPGRARN